MGDWGVEPWENDAAADWFGTLMKRTSLRELWVEGIAETGGDGEKVLAAAWLFVQLGRVHVWPVEYFDEDRVSTLKALRALKSDARMAEGDPEGWDARIENYIAEVEAR